ncbi:PilT protein domain-containing protein [Halosimplex carlsbadense 2-9-1]|uniref:PilT protein domain-containing protein n=1 Tax=Halosimplex carlsbadense 2-9-1 TaxID=797114 RepID=M0D438_9EURY|nr:putative toxin-antitoxin system toxin component, PIN family [Halosimplex carlsbadense]ELZ29598.1 PilT protein domain-containing protein [Halosimplex carlsbadense 2-9-1]
MGSVTVVLDTNVLVSALGFGGTPLEAVVYAVDDAGTEIVASDETLAELGRVMEYDRLPIAERERESFLTILRREVEVVAATESIDEIERDPDDDAFLECAIAGDADVLVSGDDHPLELGAFRGIDIVSPAGFLASVQ